MAKEKTTQYIIEQLQRGRRELLDLSTRNRLLSIPTGSKTARIVSVHDERSDEVYRLLVAERKSMSFEAGRPSQKAAADDTVDESSHGDDELELSQPDEDDDGGGTAEQQSDRKLQTKMTPETLQRRLLDMQYDADTYFEEQGVNILYLSLGQLKWYDAATSDIERFAPLLLIPVKLARKSVAQRFKITWTEADPAENISLVEKLKTDFGIKLPEFKTGDDFDLIDYFNDIATAVSTQPKWEVLPNAMVLGFFAFAKFLMWRDLDPALWPEGSEIHLHECIKALLGDGFVGTDSLYPEDTNVDAVVSVAEQRHVVDADSSQALAIECVRKGANLVIQGPPGTGKSQTITNVIAAAVADGKKVLFVAEKMAALEVVKRRLDNVGLGPLCLELHSNRSTKKHVLDAIREAWDLGAPVMKDADKIKNSLDGLRNRLNAHAELMHQPVGPSGYTPYQLIGHLVALAEVAGPVPASTLAKPHEWTRDDIEARVTVIAECAQRIASIGSPRKHPFRGVRRAGMLKSEVDRFVSHTKQSREALRELITAGAALAQTLHVPSPLTIHELQQQMLMAQHFAASPQLDRQAVANSVWAAGFSQLAKLVETGRRYAVLRQALHSAGVADAALQTQVHQARQALVQHGRSVFRVFSSEYRRAMATLRSILVATVPKSHDARVKILDAVMEAQECARTIDEHNAQGAAAFGVLWAKASSDWNVLASALQWVDGVRKAGLAEKALSTYSAMQDPKAAKPHAEQCETVSSRLKPELDVIADTIKLDLARAFGVDRLSEVPFEALAARLDAWLAAPDGVFDWMQYFAKESKAEELSLLMFVDALATGTLSPSDAAASFRKVCFERLLEKAAQENSRLAQFDGRDQTDAVDQFRQYDKRRIELAKSETATRHYQGLPGNGASIGQVGIVKGELARKRGHMPIRKLFKESADVVQAVKPVFMMSPLSVAQFLEPGAIKFDLLVMDEASQIEPVDSLGAIARCQQIAVVGDDKQLPPTRFFARVTNDGAVNDDDDDDGAAKVADLESVLTLCVAKGVPSRMLRWHYRSRHHSLIAVSNREFYGNRLYVVPSPHIAAAHMGLVFHHIADGVFDSGNTAVNRTEAKAVADAVIRHALETPELSLGVATFSLKQREAIRDELELLRKQCPETEPFFANHAHEPFFLKNLENVQGDERDVIFISVAYGRNQQGYMAMKFGPLSGQGGERRLNVLISRAKQRCEVFSSITADDVDLERGRGAGVAALKAFLNFAQTGRLGIASRGVGETDSPFEESVKRALEGRGLEVHTQVGIAGFFVDLALPDPEKPGRYVLGIECDGAAYHSSKSARDRDRLRQAVLEDHGWIIHRIWSADWFAKPAAQLERVLDAYQAAKRALEEAEGAIRTAKTAATKRTEILRTARVEPIGQTTDDYVEAQFATPSNREPHELSPREMASYVERVVEVEGPVHESEIAARIRSNWGLQRTGGRIQQAVMDGIEWAVRNRSIVRDGPFCDKPRRNATVRNRSDVKSSGLRKPEMLPNTELAVAVLEAVDQGVGAADDEIVEDVARRLGFKATSSHLRDRIDSAIVGLVSDARLVRERGMLRRTTAARSDERGEAALP